MSHLNIGVDIGSSSIKAVQIKVTNGKIRIVKAAEVPLERGIVSVGQIKSIEEVSNALNRLWKVGKFRTKDVTVGLANELVLAKTMTLPWEPKNIFRNTLRLRIGDAFAFPVGDMILDYQPLDLITSGTLIQQKALIVGAHSSMAENITEAVELSKLRIRCIDYTPFALIRAAVVTDNGGFKKKGKKKGSPSGNFEVVIDVGGQVTLVAIHKNGKPLYIRFIPAGSEAATRALADRLGLRMEVAELLKKTIGLQKVEDNQMRSPIPNEVPDNRIPEAQAILNFMAGHLVQEVRKTVEYYIANTEEAPIISRILLSGGGSMLPGYAERIASELRAPTAYLAPMHAFTKDKSLTIKDPRMSIAFGLALGVE